MKLPLVLVDFFRPNLLKNDLPLVRLVYVDSLLPADPPKQKRTVAMRRHAVAAQMKPKAYLPSEADVLFF